MIRLVIDSRLAEIERAANFVAEFCASHHLVDEDAHALGIVLDELVSNSIRHGLASAPGHSISISLDVAAGEVLMEIEDDGVPFDPTRAQAPVLAATLAQRKPGGIGIAFVRQLMDSIEYGRIGGRNRLLLRRRLR
jgi:anti-sigma regulatory factor (Ser/Thr protein kinase)